MARLASALLLIVALGLCIVPALLLADPPGVDEGSIKNTLALQEAMQQARHYLQHGHDSKQAVDLLEAQLAKVNGNGQYLLLLREAYRARFRDLTIANQPAQAKIILDRLCILEPGASTDPTLLPQPEAPRKIEPPAPPAKPAEPKQASILPDFGKWFKLGGDKTAQAPAKAPVARGVPDDADIAEDPFDPRNQRSLPISAEKLALVEQLVAKADDAFSCRTLRPGLRQMLCASLRTPARRPGHRLPRALGLLRLRRGGRGAQ